MKARYVVVTALLVAVGATSVAAVGADASKQRLRAPSTVFAGAGESTSTVDALPAAEYRARAHAICKKENKRLRAAERRLFGPPPYNVTTWTLEEWATWHRAAARFAGDSLAKLRALPLPPPRYRPWLKRWFSLYERLPTLLRQIAAAASAGDGERYNTLLRRRVSMTRQAGEIKYRIRRLLPPGCPLNLPA